MRGVAVLMAVASVWLIAVRDVPSVRLPQWRLSPTRALICVAAGMAGTTVALGLLGTLYPAIAFGIIAATIPIHIWSARARSQDRDAASAWPDLLAHIRSSVAAGATLPDAYVGAAQRVGGPFSATVDEVRRMLIFGEGFDEAMRIVRESVDDATGDRVTLTLTVANDTGGSRVGEVLAALSSSIAGETRLRQAHEAALTEQRWTAGVALAAPWLILALSIATNPQAAEAFDTAEGALVVGIGLVMTVAGWALSRRVSALSSSPRMLR